MEYDPTKIALFNPERRPALTPADGQWTDDALCSEFSRLAYIRFEAGGEPTLAEAIAPFGYGELRTFSNNATGAQAFGALSSDKGLIIAFRGTQINSGMDLIADIRILLRRWPGQGKVHRGFWNALKSILPQIEEWLKNYPGKKLLITGHSLGAAMATLLAGLETRGELVTFGSPLVGNRVFARQFARRNVRRYIDCCDLVTLVPPLPGFSHVERAKYIDRDGKMLNARPGFFARLINRFVAERAYRSRFGGIEGNNAWRGQADHAPINYVSAVLGIREPG